MTESIRGIVLVGHGGIPRGCPAELVTKLKKLEGQRRAAKTPKSQEECDIDRQIRHWPRTPDTDPYQAGLERLAARLRPLLRDAHFSTAYNEFCAPTLGEAVEQQIADGANDITVVSTMFTPGGSHSEYEIPEDMADLRARHPNVTLTYAWPFDLGKVAAMLSEHIEQCRSAPAGKGASGHGVAGRGR